MWFCEADGSQAERLVPQSAFFARVSPDGKLIALIVGRYPATTLSVCDMRGEHCHVINSPPTWPSAARVLSAYVRRRSPPLSS